MTEALNSIRGIAVTCRICGNREGNKSYLAREMLFGTREEFAYFQCASCGCLQIAEIPSDLARHYRSDYVSFKPSVEKRFASRFRNFFRVRRYRFAVLGEGTLGRLLHALAPRENLHRLSLAGLRRDSRVLDVGCGSGELLYTLRTLGMTNLLGVDAFIERDITYPNGLTIRKGTIDDVAGEWDCIILSRTLEHIPDQHATLRSVAARLAPGGTSLVTIPLVSSQAWEHYRTNWFALDAPRHLYLHSVKSFHLAAGKADLGIEHAVYTSDDRQFRGSELYLRDIPFLAGPPQSRAIFTRAQIRAWRRKAAELNAESRGDQAMFCLKKRPTTGTPLPRAQFPHDRGQA